MKTDNRGPLEITRQNVILVSNVSLGRTKKTRRKLNWTKSIRSWFLPWCQFI